MFAKRLYADLVLFCALYLQRWYIYIILYILAVKPCHFSEIPHFCSHLSQRQRKSIFFYVQQFLVENDQKIHYRRIKQRTTKVYTPKCNYLAAKEYADTASTPSVSGE